MREDLDTAAIDQLGGGDHANLHDLKVELEEAQKVNQRRANILESQQKELKVVYLYWHTHIVLSGGIPKLFLNLSIRLCFLSDSIGQPSLEQLIKCAI